MAHQEPWRYDSRLQDWPAAYGWLEDADAAAQAGLPLLFPTPGNDTLVLPFLSVLLLQLVYSSFCFLCVEFSLHSSLLMTMTALNYAFVHFFILFSLFLKLILRCCLGLHAFCSLDYVVVCRWIVCFLLMTVSLLFFFTIIFKGTEKSPCHWNWRALSGGDHSNGKGRSEGVERHAWN